MCDPTQGYDMGWCGDDAHDGTYAFIPEHSPITTGMEEELNNADVSQNNANQQCTITELRDDPAADVPPCGLNNDNEELMESQGAEGGEGERPVTPWNTVTPTYRPNTTAVTPPPKDPVGAPKVPPECPTYPVGTMPWNITGGVLPGYGSRGPITSPHPRMSQQYPAMPAVPLPGSMAHTGPMPLAASNYGHVYSAQPQTMPVVHHGNQYFGQNYYQVPPSYGHMPPVQYYGGPITHNNFPVPHGLDGMRPPMYGYPYPTPSYGYGMPRPYYGQYPAPGVMVRGTRHSAPFRCNDIPPELMQHKTVNVVEPDTCGACGHSPSSSAMAQAVHTVVHKQQTRSVFPEYVHPAPRMPSKPPGTLMIRLDPTPGMNPKVDWEEQGVQPRPQS